MATTGEATEAQTYVAELENGSDADMEAFQAFRELPFGDQMELLALSGGELAALDQMKRDLDTEAAPEAEPEEATEIESEGFWTRTRRKAALFAGAVAATVVAATAIGVSVLTGGGGQTTAESSPRAESPASADDTTDQPETTEEFCPPGERANPVDFNCDGRVDQAESDLDYFLATGQLPPTADELAEMFPEGSFPSDVEAQLPTTDQLVLTTNIDDIESLSGGVDQVAADIVRIFDFMRRDPDNLDVIYNFADRQTGDRIIASFRDAATQNGAEIEEGLHEGPVSSVDGFTLSNSGATFEQFHEEFPASGIDEVDLSIETTRKTATGVNGQNVVTSTNPEGVDHIIFYLDIALRPNGDREITGFNFTVAPA